MISHRKRGQGSGLEVSILIILIALFIGGYLILLPPEERESLLVSEGTTSADTTADTSANILLTEAPGTIVAYKTNVLQETKQEPMHLYIKDETTTNTLVKSLTVSKTLIKDNYKDVLFNIENANDIKQAKLAFFITESKGELTIKLNGNTIYEGELATTDLPINLPKEYLQNKNVLEFSTSSPGWKIFSSHYYLIKDMTLIKEVSTKKVKASRTFSIGETDNKVRKATMDYFINCNKESDGAIKITVNNRQIFEDTVFCQYLENREQRIPAEYINDGRNVIDFEIDKGDYNIDEIRLKMELEKSTLPQYSFDVSSELYDNIQDGKEKAYLHMKFPTDSNRKATITIGDKQFTMDISKTEYTRDISSIISLGSNQLKIEPADTFEISKLQIKVE